MKIFYEVKVDPGEGGDRTDIVVARLAEIGFDGFMEEGNHLLAYCEKADSTREDIKAKLQLQEISVLSIREIQDENWNANWEAEYDAVYIDNRLIVRAPFHQINQGFEYDIIIEPRMSFGTAHHETTSQMLEIILVLELQGKSVLDMGSGTAVLAILAQKRGSVNIVAIDNDEWAYQNARDNIKLNDAEDISVELGDATTINGRQFDIIFANINRNILLKDIPEYAEALLSPGKLLLSGFYEDDLPLIKEKCSSCGLKYNDGLMKNNWMAAIFTKD